jgi:hypothetical protein
MEVSMLIQTKAIALLVLQASFAMELLWIYVHLGTIAHLELQISTILSVRLGAFAQKGARYFCLVQKERTKTNQDNQDVKAV